MDRRNFLAGISAALAAIPLVADDHRETVVFDRSIRGRSFANQDITVHGNIECCEFDNCKVTVTDCGRYARRFCNNTVIGGGVSFSI